MSLSVEMGTPVLLGRRRASPILGGQGSSKIRFLSGPFTCLHTFTPHQLTVTAVSNGHRLTRLEQQFSFTPLKVRILKRVPLVNSDGWSSFWGTSDSSVVSLTFPLPTGPFHLQGQQGMSESLPGYTSMTSSSLLPSLTQSPHGNTESISSPISNNNPIRLPLTYELVAHCLEAFSPMLS